MLNAAEGLSFSRVEGTEWLVDQQAVVTYARYVAARQPKTRGNLVLGALPLPVAKLDREPTQIEDLLRRLVQTMIDEVPAETRDMSPFRRVAKDERFPFGWHIDYGSTPAGRHAFKVLCNDTDDPRATTLFAGPGTELDPFKDDDVPAPIDCFPATSRVVYLFPTNLTLHTPPTSPEEANYADLYMQTFGMEV